MQETGQRVTQISHMAEGTLWLTEPLIYTPHTSPPSTPITTHRILCQIRSCPPLLSLPCLKWYKWEQKKKKEKETTGSHTFTLDSPTVMNHHTAGTCVSKSRLCQFPDSQQHLFPSPAFHYKNSTASFQLQNSDKNLFFSLWSEAQQPNSKQLLRTVAITSLNQNLSPPTHHWLAFKN